MPIVRLDENAEKILLGMMYETGTLKPSEAIKRIYYRMINEKKKRDSLAFVREQGNESAD